LSDLAVVATSKNSVGLVVGVIVGVVLIGLGVFFYRDRVEKKKKKQQRTNGHFRASAEMT
jgi:predicted transporter